MKIRIMILVLLLVASLPLSAQFRYNSQDYLNFSDDPVFEAGVGGGLGYHDMFTNQLLFDASFSSPHLAAALNATFNRDDRYEPDIANMPDGTLFNRYFLMETGALAWQWSNMTLQAGRMSHTDIIDSPYSLFINSRPIPAMILNFRYENDFIIYETRWIELNRDSNQQTPSYYPRTGQEDDDNPYVPDGVQDNELSPFSGGFPDRGAVVRVYALKLGNRMRFGFQDATVFIDRAFDLEYFLNPIPGYIIQHERGTDGRPWSTGYNDKSLMGAFWDWQYSDELYVNSQIIIDDGNIGGLGGSTLNPWKAAYSLGATYETQYGTFGLHNAAAFKYSFDGTRPYSDQSYPYAYYPDTRFEATIDGKTDYYPIPIEDLMIGYYNGENNLSFRLDYEHRIREIDIESSLEFSLSGAKSPANAWHELLNYQDEREGSRFLDDDVLEKKLVMNISAGKQFGNWHVLGNLKLGYAFNALELQPPWPDGPPEGYYDDHNPDRVYYNDNTWVWRPGSSHEPILGLGLTVRYAIPAMSWVGRER